jgi:hypothetical protein
LPLDERNIHAEGLRFITAGLSAIGFSWPRRTTQTFCDFDNKSGKALIAALIAMISILWCSEHESIPLVSFYTKAMGNLI